MVSHKRDALCVALLTIAAIAAFIRSPVLAQNSRAHAATGTIVYERDLKDENANLLDKASYTPDIYSINADGTNDKALTTDGHSHSPVWTPDGQHILFIHDAAAQTDANGKSYSPAELYVMDRDGRDLRLIRRLKRPEGTPFAAPSPDGQTLVLTFPFPWPNDDLAPGLYLLPASGQGDIRFPALGLSSALLPIWSPDGKRIAYSTGFGDKLAARIVNADGSGETQFPDPNLAAATPTAWTPDGKKFYAITLKDTWALHIVDADGSGEKRLTDSDTIVQQAALSPDSKQIAFAGLSRSKRQGGIFAMSQDGSEVRLRKRLSFKQTGATSTVTGRSVRPPTPEIAPLLRNSRRGRQ